MALLMVSTISHVLTAGDGKMDLMNDGVNLMDPQPNPLCTTLQDDCSTILSLTSRQFLYSAQIATMVIPRRHIRMFIVCLRLVVKKTASRSIRNSPLSSCKSFGVGKTSSAEKRGLFERYSIELIQSNKTSCHFL
ncbi:hypothetical protein BD769DRAFT_1058403 [Suillus cothurnatus]|nr:hypothetical protein BD769DRAFT_1058403 [Suillus cothurnatus]